MAEQRTTPQWRVADAPHIPSDEEIVRGLLNAMEMQERRETGEYHISQDVALGIWNDAKEHAQRWLSIQSETAPHVLDLVVRQAVIDWNRAHVEPGRPFPPLDIDAHQEGSLADAVLRAIRALPSAEQRHDEEDPRG